MQETDLHAAQTERFIDYAPTSLVFSREVHQPDGAGGVLVAQTSSLPHQRVRVVGQVRPPTRVTAEGRQIQADKAVVGMPDLDVEIGDTFDHAGHTYEVINVQRDPAWRVVAEAVSRG